MATTPPLYTDTSAMYDEKFAFGFKGGQAQLFYLFCHFCFYLITINPLARIIHNCLRKKKYYSQYETLTQEMMLKGYMTPLDKEGAARFGTQILVICGMQHLVGGFLCLPAVANFWGYPGLANSLGISPSLAIFMAKQGAMCEAGWELSDGLIRGYQKFIQGRHDLQPKALCILMAVHHTLGLTMVVPMCTYYGGHPLFHETVFLLQFAAGVALTLQQFGFMLNIAENSADLFKMKIYVLITFVCMWWARGIRYVWILYSFVTYFLAFENYTMVAAVIFQALVMGLLNLLMIVDSTKKTSKYLSMTMEDAKKAAEKKT